MTSEDREAIRELKYSYCYRLDSGDVDGFPDLFTSDAEFEVLSSGGPVTSNEGLRDWVAWRQNYILVDGEERELDASSHVALNPIIDISGGQATGQWYYLVLLGYADGTVELGQGRYRDVYRLIGDEWKIAALNAERLQTIRLDSTALL